MANIDALFLGFPFDYIALARGFESGSHNGIDMGWHSTQGGKNIPCHAPADGTVVAVVDGKNNNRKNTSDYGNYIKIQHADNVYTLMAHLEKGSITVKVGDTVIRHQEIAKMGNSGYSFGNHCHYEVFNGGSGGSYKVDPLLYTYVYDGMVVGETTKVTYPIKYYVAPEPEIEVKDDIDESVTLDVYTVEQGDSTWNIKKLCSAHPGETIKIPNDK